MTDIILILILAAVVAVISIYLWRRKKAGKSACGCCSGGCSGCSGGCSGISGSGVAGEDTVNKN